jgi:hypothetical protein
VGAIKEAFFFKVFNDVAFMYHPLPQGNRAHYGGATGILKGGIGVNIYGLRSVTRTHGLTVVIRFRVKNMGIL